jgi:hypothetical protein
VAVILPSQTRNAGTYQGALSQTGVPIPPDATVLTVALTMAQTDVDDGRNSCVYTVEGDYGNGWEFIFGDTWTGGYPVKPGVVRVAPVWAYSTTTRPFPRDIRATMQTNRRWVWGVDITVS